MEVDSLQINLDCDLLEADRKRIAASNISLYRSKHFNRPREEEGALGAWERSPRLIWIKWRWIDGVKTVGGGGGRRTLIQFTPNRGESKETPHYNWLSLTPAHWYKILRFPHLMKTNWKPGAGLAVQTFKWSLLRDFVRQLTSRSTTF